MSELNWTIALAAEKNKDYFKNLIASVQAERDAGKEIYPKSTDVFNSLRLTPLEEVKVVIIGQDPYHGPGQAHGLCFSVPEGIPKPPSLQNIFKELQADLDFNIPNHGNLTAWAKQGVLLLNSVLTVEAHQAASHSKLGWQQFTDKVIEVVGQQKENVIFMLWGAYAQKKSELIDQEKNLILTAPHPSPLSAHRGFLGCKHFSTANAYLALNNKEAINWQL